MTPVSPPSLLTLRFRTSAAFDLVVFDRLPLEEQALLQPLRTDPELYGVLKPRQSQGLTVKSADRATALLLLTLRDAGPLPFFVFEGSPEETETTIEQLVLDRILEVEVDGAFLAGAEALPALQDLRPSSAESARGGDEKGGNSPIPPEGRLAQISRAALLHGESAEVDEPEPLAALLYGFNREPLTPAWAARLPHAAAVLDFLGLAPGGSLARTVAATWEFGERESSPGWIAFTPRQGAPRRSDGVPFKLYVSPQIAELPRAFARVTEVLATRGAGSFKVGSDAAGLLRADKLVLYFQDLESLLATARMLEAHLAGLPAQGVPFSAPIDRAGLLSWGVDPPTSGPLAAWQGQESWRQWVARRLATNLLAARASGPASQTAPPAWRFALERLQREGVDVDRWTPTALLWAAA